LAKRHVVLIAGLIRWSLAARASSSQESIVWLGNAQDVTAEQAHSGASPATTPKALEVTSPAAAEPLKNDEPEEEKREVTTAKSEIELPAPTPKPTPASTTAPKPTGSPTPKPKATPKPLPKPTPKKTLLAKASPKPSTKAKAISAKASEKSEKKAKIALAKNDSTSQSGSGKTGSTGKGSVGGGSTASEFGWYGNMLHDRFYSAWIQPTTNVPSGTKISTLVKVRIEKDGRVSKFEIVKPSENVVVNESVAVIGKRVTQVDPPPAGLINGDHYDVKINFELNTDQAAAK
jgi:outer membrane biosynthesis protein TonB